MGEGTSSICRKGVCMESATREGYRCTACAPHVQRVRDCRAVVLRTGTEVAIKVYKASRARDQGKKRAGRKRGQRLRRLCSFTSISQCQCTEALKETHKGEDVRLQKFRRPELSDALYLYLYIYIHVVASAGPMPKAGGDLRHSIKPLR